MLMTIDLKAWIQSNPGKFKYSAPPTHFAGSMNSSVSQVKCSSRLSRKSDRSCALHRLVRRGRPWATVQRIQQDWTAVRKW